MNHYLVVHDGLDRLVGSTLMGALKCYPGWRRIADNCYVIASTQPADVIYAKVRYHLACRDHIYVFDLGALWYGSAPVEVADWLSNSANLGVAGAS